jgi:hypothetical protein
LLPICTEQQALNLQSFMYTFKIVSHRLHMFQPVGTIIVHVLTFSIDLCWPDDYPNDESKHVAYVILFYKYTKKNCLTVIKNS